MSIIIALLLPVNLVGEGFMILSLSLAESSVHSRPLSFAKRLRLATASRSGACIINVVFPLFPACGSAPLQELVAEW
jgi:hypothetical protein